MSQAVARNTQDVGRLQLIASSVTEHKGEQLPLHRGQRFGVKRCRPGVETIGEEALPVQEGHVRGGGRAIPGCAERCR